MAEILASIIQKLEGLQIHKQQTSELKLQYNHLIKSVPYRCNVILSIPPKQLHVFVMVTQGKSIPVYSDYKK